MTKLCILILLTSAMFGLQAGWAEDASCASLSVSGPPEYYPIAYKDGDTIKGVGVDLAKMAAVAADIPISVSYKGSWSRVLQQHALGNIDVIVGLYHTEAREKTMTFLPAFWTEEAQIVMRRDQPIPYQGWLDLRGYRGVTISSDSRGDRFDAFMRRELDMLYVHSQEVAFNLLKAGRVDFMITGQYSMFDTTDFGPDAALTIHPEPVDEHKIYMAFSRQSRCIELATRFSQALAKLIDDGQVAPLFANHPTVAQAAKAE